MKKRSKKQAPKMSSQACYSPAQSLEVHAELERLSKQIQDLTLAAKKSEDRIEDLEIHVHLLTRLVTTLCIEKLGMRVGVLKRMIQKIEKDAVRDSQIMHLESLYNMPGALDKSKPNPKTPIKNDPWDEIA